MVLSNFVWVCVIGLCVNRENVDHGGKQLKCPNDKWEWVPTEGVRIFGANVQFERSENHDECNQICESTPGCLENEYDEGRKSCFLHFDVDIETKYSKYYSLLEQRCIEE